MMNMQVAILAGGLATRLGALTEHQPKSMVRIHGRPFLEYQLEFLRRAGIRHIVVCLGHMGEQIERHFGNGENHGVEIRYSFEDKPMGTAGALKEAEPLLADMFISLYGDSYLFLDFNAIVSYFNSQNKLALMTVYKNNNRWDRSNTVIENNLVRKYDKTEETEDMVYIEYGANVFRKETLEMIPAGQYHSLDTVFPKLVEKEELLAFEVKQRFHEIGSPDGFREFEEYIEGVR